MFTTVLVANRGEIACRVLRTLHDLGVRSVAVHSDADARARHVQEADTSVRIGPAAPQESYLDVDAVVRAALTSGAQAIHPGYGFLSENPALARACAQAGLVLVGPDVEALELMGDKIRAKEHVVAAGVPVVPGFTGEGLDDEALAAAADEVGYPLLVKPSAGGGGKGMHVVERPEDLTEALRGARRVALAAFGDDTLLVERYLHRPRHIEVQVLADRHGTVVHLGERECSLQRRHQKVVEEAPSPLLDPAARAHLGDLACRVARSVGYVGAGTVEMLVADDDVDHPYFIEMNTRLQVEHPVTEMVTGLDLVEWQLRVAAGEPLAFGQEDVHLTGHAVEARVYAEDPARGFLPATGRVLVLDEPRGPGVRVDSALLPGLEVSPTYDPMLAKVVAHGRDRAEALARLDAALARTTVLGVPTTVDLLRHVLADDDVRAGRLHTGLLERLVHRLEPHDPDDDMLLVAALTHLEQLVGPGRGPWRRDAWRAGDHPPHRVEILGRRTHAVTVRGAPTAARVAVDDGPERPASLRRTGPDAVDLDLDGTVRAYRVAVDAGAVWVGRDGAAVVVRVRSRADRLAEELSALSRRAAAVDPEVRTPMPGTVVAVDVADGDPVLTGQPLLTVEAMKMEHRLVAPVDGVVRLTAREADLVKVDQVVATVTPHPEGTPA